MHVVAALLLLLSLLGSGYTMHAAIAVRRFARRRGAPAVAPEPVTLLKPLHGAEPRLAENLATFLRQDWFAPIQMVAGVQRADDPAIDVAHALGPQVRMVVETRSHGANAKVSNLINMAPAAEHDLLVLSDSDMAAPPDYLAQVVAALAQPGVGAVTCLYRGRGDAGPWSTLAAGAISYAFLPAVLVGLSLRLAQPCMGSTIALRRGTLERIGGFHAFADMLADDYAIGEAVRAQGLTIATPPPVLTHGFTERSLADLWRHELRWAATVRAVAPVSSVGMVVTHPVSLALLALPFVPAPAGVLLALALAARFTLRSAVDRLCHARTMPAWALPARDILSFVVFIASFFVRSVDWRGARFRMEREGRIAPAPESPPR